MSEEIQSPNFDSLRQLNPYGQEYWSARDLAPLLGYANWQNFEVAIKRAKTSAQQVGQAIENHFTEANKMVRLGSGAQRQVKDYILSRLACYLIAQNGDPRKPEIAAAQNYFAIATRENELTQLREAQAQRLELRERVSENNKDLAQAAHDAGVLSRNFGVFQDAGYKGLYGGKGVEDLKLHKNIGDKEDLLDRMGAEELAANDFRITQTAARLRREGIIGQSKATQAHHEVGRKIRQTIEELGGAMPEDLPAEPTIKPLVDERKRRNKKALQSKDSNAADHTNNDDIKQREIQDKLF